MTCEFLLEMGKTFDDKSVSVSCAADESSKFKVTGRLCSTFVNLCQSHRIELMNDGFTVEEV